MLQFNVYVLHINPLNSYSNLQNSHEINIGSSTQNEGCKQQYLYFNQQQQQNSKWFEYASES